jgi:hypothetical protein
VGGEEWPFIGDISYHDKGEPGTSDTKAPAGQGYALLALAKILYQNLLGYQGA